MTATNANHKEANEVLALVQDWIKAASAMDTEGVMKCYTDDILSFDAIAELQFKGVDAYKKHWDNCMSFMPAGARLVFDINELNVVANGDLAFGHYLTHCGMQPASGEPHLTWMRCTFCCRKLNGKWKIVHEHFSVPYDPQDNTALTALKP